MWETINMKSMSVPVFMRECVNTAVFSVWQTFHFDNCQVSQWLHAQWPVSCVNTTMCFQCGKLFILTIIKNHQRFDSQWPVWIHICFQCGKLYNMIIVKNHNNLIHNGLSSVWILMCAVWQTFHFDNHQESQWFDSPSCVADYYFLVANDLIEKKQKQLPRTIMVESMSFFSVCLVANRYAHRQLSTTIML